MPDKWKKAFKRFREHEINNYHLNSTMKADNFLNVKSGKISGIDVVVNNWAENDAKENRVKIVTIIETVILCGRQRIALRGHRDHGTFDLENPPIDNEGNFRDSLRARIDAGDTNLKNYFESVILIVAYCYLSLIPQKSRDCFTLL